MNLFSSFSRKTAPRCEHLSSSGRRCSQPACSSHPTLCFTHKPKAEPVQSEKPHRTPAADAAFLAEITQVCGDLETPEQVRRALSLTLKAFVSRQISRETAGTTTYILQMLLRSLREIAYHQKLEQASADKMQSVHAQELPLSWNVPDARRGPVEPEDIARAERELENLRERAAQEAGDLGLDFGVPRPDRSPVAQASACVPNAKPDSPADAFPSSSAPSSLCPVAASLPLSSLSASSLSSPPPPSLDAPSVPRPATPLRSEPRYNSPYEEYLRTGRLNPQTYPTRLLQPL